MARRLPYFEPFAAAAVADVVAAFVLDAMACHFNKDSIS